MSLSEIAAKVFSLDQDRQICPRRSRYRFSGVSAAAGRDHVTSPIFAAEQHEELFEVPNAQKKRNQTARAAERVRRERERERETGNTHDSTIAEGSDNTSMQRGNREPRSSTSNFWIRGLGFSYSFSIEPWPILARGRPKLCSDGRARLYSISIQFSKSPGFDY